MNLQITPEPPEGVRAELERILGEARAEDATPSAWWLAGVRESAGLDED